MTGQTITYHPGKIIIEAYEVRITKHTGFPQHTSTTPDVEDISIYVPGGSKKWVTDRLYRITIEELEEG